MPVSNKNDIQTFEDRLQPWLDQAEYLIIFIIGVMAWSAIFVNFIGFAYSEVEIGIYSTEPSIACGDDE